MTPYLIGGLVGAFLMLVGIFVLGLCMVSGNADRASEAMAARQTLLDAAGYAFRVLMEPRSESEDDDDERTSHAADLLARAMLPFGYEQCSDCARPVRPKELSPVLRRPALMDARIDHLCERCREFDRNEMPLIRAAMKMRPKDARAFPGDVKVWS